MPINHKHMVTHFDVLESITDKIIERVIKEGVFKVLSLKELHYDKQLAGYRIQLMNASYDIGLSCCSQLPEFNFSKLADDKLNLQYDSESKTYITSSESTWYATKVKELEEGSDLLKLFKRVKFDFTEIKKGE